MRMNERCVWKSFVNVRNVVAFIVRQDSVRTKRKSEFLYANRALVLK